MSLSSQYKKELPSWVRFATKLADIAGVVSASYFRRIFPQSYQKKKDLSLVSLADKEAEKKMRAAIEEQFPKHGILGEEYGFKRGESDLTWILDPIDGSISFACGKMEFVNLIALVDSQSFLLGIINQPLTQERWIGAQNQKSTFNSKTCTSSQVRKLSEARLGSTYPFFYEPRLKEQKREVQDVFLDLTQKAKMSSFGGDGYGYGLVASGYMDVFLDAHLHFYDYAALIPILEGAGALISDWLGKPLSPHFEKKSSSSVLACSTPELQTQVLDLIFRS